MNTERSTVPVYLNVLYFGEYNMIIDVYLLRYPRQCITFGELVPAEYKYSSSGPTTLCFDTLMGSGTLLGFGGMCQKKDTVCQL